MPACTDIDYIGFRMMPPSSFNRLTTLPSLGEEADGDNFKCSAFGEYVPFLHSGPELFVPLTTASFRVVTYSSV